MKAYSEVTLAEDNSIVSQPTHEQKNVSFLAKSTLTINEEALEEEMELVSISDLDIIGMSKKSPKKSEEDFEEDDFDDDFDDEDFDDEDFEFDEDFDDDFDDLDFIDDEDDYDDYDDDFF